MKAACDWSNLVGRLTGKNQPGLFSLVLDSNLCGCLKPELCAQSDRPVWPDEISSIFREVCVTIGDDLQSSTSWEVLIEVWNVAWAWLLISLGELIPSSRTSGTC